MVRESMETEELAARYYLPFAASFVRGRLPGTSGEDAAVFAAGQASGLKLHKFKRNADLPRVKKVLSLLAGLAPDSLLDVGSGRGVFLWPLLDAFPDLPVTAIDKEEQRASDLQAIGRGGLSRLRAERMDATALTFADSSFDGVTMLEVLEHMPDPKRAAQSALRVAQRFVVVSVPSKEDENPEHIHLFDRQSLPALFEGARRVTVEHVLNHIVALVLK